MCCNANHSSFLTSASFVVVNFGGAVDLMPSPELLLGKCFIGIGLAIRVGGHKTAAYCLLCSGSLSVAACPIPKRGCIGELVVIATGFKVSSITNSYLVLLFSMCESALGPHGLLYSRLHSDLGRKCPNLLFLLESTSLPGQQNWFTG
uniref:Uncharacterized protein n=1 Tax=Solanum tuberosum TaxID=4113 RepID=M1DQ23_SOLTU